MNSSYRLIYFWLPGAVLAHSPESKDTPRHERAINKVMALRRRECCHTKAASRIFAKIHDPRDLVDGMLAEQLHASAPFMSIVPLQSVTASPQGEWGVM